jgi:enoyl-CoA hydratase/carnithine racemase
MYIRCALNRNDLGDVLTHLEQDLTDRTTEGVSASDIIITKYQPILVALETSIKLTIAAVNGPAAGGGSAIALACDLVIMASDAYLAFEIPLEPEVN